MQSSMLSFCGLCCQFHIRPFATLVVTCQPPFQFYSTSPFNVLSVKHVLSVSACEALKPMIDSRKVKTPWYQLEFHYDWNSCLPYATLSIMDYCWKFAFHNMQRSHFSALKGCMTLKLLKCWYSGGKNCGQTTENCRNLWKHFYCHRVWRLNSMDRANVKLQIMSVIFSIKWQIWK